MLWQVAAHNPGGKNGLHILASTHLARAELHLTPATRLALDNAEFLVLETDVSVPPDPSIYAASKGESAPWIDYLNRFNSLAAEYGFKPEFGTEASVARYKNWARPRSFLESIGDSLKPIIECPLSELETLLDQLTHGRAELAADLEMLVDAVERGDADVIERYLKSTSSRTPVLNEGLLARRNRNWVPRLSELATGGERVVAVIGALHVVGPDNVPELLRAKGLEVTRLD